MIALLYVGLLIALIGSPLLMAIFKRLNFNQFSPIPRLTLWAAAVSVLIIAATNFETWGEYFGLEWPTWKYLGLSIVVATILLFALSVHASLRGKFGAASPEQLDLQRKLLSLPFGHRCFLVMTAAVTEEILYRGYAIGVGQHLLGSTWVACIFSIAAFTLSHLRWGLAHLIPVFICALVITLLFTFTQNLVVCIVVHAILDGMGVLVAPIIMARRRRIKIEHE